MHRATRKPGHEYESGMSTDYAEKTPDHTGKHHGQPPKGAEQTTPKWPRLSRLADNLVPRCPICRSRNLRISGSAPLLTSGRCKSGTCVCAACGIKFQPSLLQTILMRRAAPSYHGHVASRVVPQDPAWSFRPSMTHSELPELFHETLGEHHLSRYHKSSGDNAANEPLNVRESHKIFDTESSYQHHLPEPPSPRPIQRPEFRSHQLERAFTRDGPLETDIRSSLERAFSEVLRAAKAVAYLRWHELECRTRPCTRNQRQSTPGTDSSKLRDG